jgi:hypothetical protein
MADPDPLAPPSPNSLLRLPGGRLSINPYSGLFAGLSAEQVQAYNLLTHPIFKYSFCLAGCCLQDQPIHIADFSPVLS